jgi:hypothetical protein
MDWIDVATKLGVPVAALVALGYGVWRVIVWCGTNLVVPVRDKHAAFLDRLIGNLDALRETHAQSVTTQQQMQATQRDQAVALDQIAVTQKDQTLLLREHGEQLREHTNKLDQILKGKQS